MEALLHRAAPKKEFEWVPAPARDCSSFVLVTSGSSTAFAAKIQVGFGGFFAGYVNPPGVQTIVQEQAPANIDGKVTSAVFGWTATPCPAAVKVKFFRPRTRDLSGVQTFDFIEERGPFDVDAPAQRSTLFQPPVTQLVGLVPPVRLSAGDVIAITNLTSCGGPTYTSLDGRPLEPTSFSVPGDLVSTVCERATNRAVLVYASGESSTLVLLGSRFAVTLVATDPRTGASSVGMPNELSDRAGFFSLPDFTGDKSFPEVMVKMVDATGSPALGGDFWFFHSPLTDVSYTLTVKDQVRDATRTYTNGSGTPGQLCGGVDTSAFPP
jgi:hypothetical protein